MWRNNYQHPSPVSPISHQLSSMSKRTDVKTNGESFHRVPTITERKQTSVCLPRSRSFSQTPLPSPCRSTMETHVPFRPPHVSSLAPLKSGIPGAAAAACQSASFMWLSTTAAFQYRSGFSMADALRYLYAQGGIARFYTGVLPTVLHVATCRFGDTTANQLALLHGPTDSIPLKTAMASVAAAAWRVSLMPLETVRANLQVRGRPGLDLVTKRYQSLGLRALYSGGVASFTASLLGHFPFFCTVNIVSHTVPLEPDAPLLTKIARNGGMGFAAAMCSDIVTNGFKIVATNKQTCDKGLTYHQHARKIVRTDGIPALITRGLKTKLIANGLQGATFVLLWKEIESWLVHTRFHQATHP